MRISAIAYPFMGELSMGIQSLKTQAKLARVTVTSGRGSTLDAMDVGENRSSGPRKRSSLTSTSHS